MSDMVNAKVFFGFITMLIGSAIIAVGLARSDREFFYSGVALVEGVSMFFLGRATARPKGRGS